MRRQLACHCRPPANRGLRGLGAVDLSQFNLAQQLFGQSKAQLQSIYQQYVANPGVFSADTGTKLTEAQSRYTTLLDAYIYAYGLATGKTFDAVNAGLAGGQGLGQFVTYIAAGVGIAAIVAGLYELNKFMNALQSQTGSELAAAQAKLQATQNIASAQQQMAAAQAAGDTNAVAQWQAVIDSNSVVAGTPPSGSESFGDFLTNNWMWIAGGVGALFFAREIL